MNIVVSSANWNILNSSFISDSGIEYIFSGGKNSIEVSDGYHTMSELYQHRYALFCALVKVYDNYKTPLGSHIRCFKSRFCPKDQLWDNERFICWMEISNMDSTIDRIGYLIPNEFWKNFNVMIEYGDVPLGIKIDSNEVIERLMKL